MSPSSERNQEARRIFQQAIRLDWNERLAFARRASDGDETIYAEVCRLLDSYEPDLSTVREAHDGDEPDERDTTAAEVPTSNNPPRPGANYGHYGLVRQIGAGGMGVVWHAIDASLDRAVALKFLPVDLASDPNRMRRFRNEAKMVASLNHPNIVVIHAIHYEETPFIVMEFVDGQTLRELLKSGEMSVRQVLDCAIPVADALAAAHAHGVTHRDIKPENVMITRGGRVKVLDFGIAKRQLSATELKRVGGGLEGIVGTPSYMSPEQLAGGEADPRSDVFAFGVMLYEMTSGVRPFSGGSVDEIRESMNRFVPASLSESRDLPASLDAIVRRCLERDPPARPKNMAAVLDELLAVRRDLDRAILQGYVAGTTEQIPSFSEPRAVAVLPLQNLGGEPSMRFLAVGVSEEIGTELSRVPNLRVVVASRVDRESVGPLELGKMLEVAAVVEGSIQRAGDQTRVTVQLISVPDGTVLWASRFDRPTVDAFSIQDEVAQAVAKAFDTQLAPRRAGRGYGSPDAYAAYLRGRYFWGRRYEDGLKRALECFGEALAMEPTMAKAHAGFADCFVILGHYGYMEPADAYLRARDSAERSLSISPDLAEAHCTLGWILAFYDWKWIEAEASLRRACELDPNYATAWEWFGIFLLSRGRHDEALEALKRAQRLDPLSLMNGTIHGWANYEIGRTEEGDRIISAVGRMDPRFVFALNVQGGIMAASGRAEAAIDLLERSVALSGREGLALSFLGFAYGRAGRRNEAKTVADELQAAGNQRYVSKLQVALPLIGAGENEEALGWLEKAVGERDSFFATTHFSMLFKTLRGDERFTALVRLMGLGA